MGYVFEDLSYLTIGACIAVQKQLGRHCMEVDYQRALELELRKRGIEYVREAEIPICYDGLEITRRRADFVVWDKKDVLLLEIKAAREVKLEDKEQCYLYMQNGGFSTCLLVNFGEFPVKTQRLKHSTDREPLYGPRR